MKTRIPILVTGCLLAILVCLGWHNHQRIVVLRTSLKNLTGEAATYGLADANKSANFVRTSKRKRPDRTAEAKQVAAAVIAYGMEFGDLREGYLRSEPAVRLRVMEETERLLALNGEQLKTLIGEVMACENIAQFQRAEIVVFALRRLAADHPRETLELLTDSPGIWKQISNREGYPHNMISTAAYGWAVNDFPAALDWLRQHRENNCAMIGVVLNAAERDPRTALSIINELGVSTETFPRYFAGAAKTPEQRIAMLKVLHDWRATAAGPSDFVLAARDVVFGQHYRTEGFDTATRCMEAADLSTDELGSITEYLEVKSGEVGQWIGWLKKNLPAEMARNRIQKLMPKWHEAEPEAAAAFAIEYGQEE